MSSTRSLPHATAVKMNERVDAVKCRIFIIFIMGFVLFSTALLHAALIDKGKSGEMFFDDVSGLYWYDPATFAGWTGDEVEVFLTANATWKQAGYSEISSLVSSISGLDYKEVSLPGTMGAATYVLPDILSSWIGIIDPQQGFAAAGIFLDAGSSDGSLSMELYSTLDDASADIGSKSQQAISGTILYGAWLYTESDPLAGTAPVPEPSTLILIGTGLIGAAGIMKKSGKISSGHRR